MSAHVVEMTTDDNQNSTTKSINEVIYRCGGNYLFESFLYLSFLFLRICQITACGKENGIKPQDPIRCRKCGYRILYKNRTNRRKILFF